MNMKIYPAQSNRFESLGDYMRRSNEKWKSRNFLHRQSDIDWYLYLRNRSNLPKSVNVPHGKRQRNRYEELLHNRNDDVGIRKIDFESPPVTLSWLDIQAKAPPKDKGIKRIMKKACCPWKDVDEPKLLLKGVSGIAKPGQLVAIMGASGAGKTTLMNGLTSRRPGTLKFSGEVRVNGTLMGRRIHQVAGYVQQEELFVPSMTAREHLYFHAMLRLRRNFTKQDRIDRVEELLDFLNLRSVEKTMIGEPGRIKGLSGGEKRRLLFAAEVLSDPPLLFADEPTTGLDGSMAFVICDAMRRLANQGKTIICTIHQPSSEIFQLFDTLYLLAEGRVAYFGSRAKAQEFFSSLGYSAPKNYNVSDFYIQTLAILPFDRDASLERVDHICNQYEKTGLYAQRMVEIESYHQVNDDQRRSAFKMFGHSSKYNTGFFTQLRWLLWRSFINALRNPFELRLRLVVSIIVGLFLGLIFLQLPYDQKSFQNISAVVFILIINGAFACVSDAATRYNQELPLFLKEHDDGIYRLIPYYFSKWIIELPNYALTSFIMITIVYWMTNLYNNVRRFFIFQGIIILCTFVSLSAGSFIGVVAPTTDAATAMVVPFLIPLLIFAGFFLSIRTIPQWLLGIKYISWLYYANEMAIINQWEDVTSLECNPVGNVTCFKDGMDVINFYGFSTSNYYRNLGILFALFLGFRLLSITILALRTKFQKKTQ